MENSKRNLIIGAGAVIVFALIIAYGLYSKSRGLAGGGISEPGMRLDAAGEPILSEAEKARSGPFPTITKEEIKPTEKIKVPEIGGQTAPDVAVPVTVQPAAPGISAKYRAFNIKGEKNQFDPSTIIVKTGDTVHINFTAVDKTYDFILPDYGMVQTAGPGETRIVEFGAMTAGKFTYYCKLCGGIDSTAVGQVIVVP